jgi:uncharacterized protein YcgI (DUF1989 family)
MERQNWGSRLVPQPFNLFMNTIVKPDGTLIIRDPISKPGDMVVFHTEIDLIVVISACPMDLNPVGGQGISDLEILIGDRFENFERELT